MKNNFRKYFSPKLGFAIVAGIAVASMLFFLSQGDMGSATYDGPQRAVIIDQLYDDMPNLFFHDQATKFLTAAGYQVDIVTTKDITVDFYKNLPKMNYKYVVVRTHGAENSQDVVLFTGEKYTEDRYITEQFLGQVQKAAPLLEVAYTVNDDGGSKWVKVNDTYSYMKTPAKPVMDSENEFFAISDDLVNHGMNGRFDQTIFILGGCNTLSNPSLAKSLIDKGAQMVVGWDNTVGNVDNDSAMLHFLETTLVENLPVDEVLEGLPQNQNQRYMAYPATLTYYPRA